MEFSTERLFVRDISINDLYDMHAYSSDPENTSHMVYLPRISIDETREFIESVERERKKEKPEFYEMAVCLDGKLIGHVSLYMADNGGELAWIIDKRYWGKGYATEAVRGLMLYMREKLGIHHFFAMCDWRNEASRRVMVRLGMEFEYEGVRPYQEDGKDVPELVYGMNI